MKSVKVWIDADSCPRFVRRYVLKRAAALRLDVSFVANRPVPVQDAPAGFCMVVCGKGANAADDIIAAEAAEYDLVITRDVPLAARLVQKGVCVINDRGTLFCKDNIEDLLADRDFDLQLVQIGFGGASAPSYGKKEAAAFAQRFDKEIQHLIRDAACPLC